MTVIETIGTIEVTTEHVRQLLDSPDNQSLNDNTITNRISMAFDYISNKIDITTYDDIKIVNAVYSFGTWQLYMTSIESINKYLNSQNPNDSIVILEHFKSLAIVYMNEIGIDLIDELGLDKSTTGSTSQGGINSSFGILPVGVIGNTQDVNY